MSRPRHLVSEPPVDDDLAGLFDPAGLTPGRAMRRVRVARGLTRYRAVILQALRDGQTRSAAAAAGELTLHQLNMWADLHPKFGLEMLVAEGQAELRIAGVVTKAAINEPRYALEWLKRQRRDDWGDRIDIASLPTDRLLALLEGHYLAAHGESQDVIDVTAGESDRPHFLSADDGVIPADPA